MRKLLIVALISAVLVTKFSLAIAEGTENLLPNSSFEYCTQDELADYWSCGPQWGIIDAYWAANFEEWVKNFGTDETTAFEGKRSIRISNPFDRPGGDGLSLTSVWLTLVPTKEYIFSAYMKSNPSGMKVNFEGKEVVLTEEWQRYSTFLVKKGSQSTISIYPIEKGTFWIDAVQLEEGKEVAGYNRSAIDKVLQSLVGKEGTTAYDVPRLKAQKIEDKIVLDGLLNEKVWQEAEKLNFVLVNGGTPTESTYASLIYNEKGIYIGIYCSDENAAKSDCNLGYNNKESHKDGFVWMDPSIEMFIDPGLTKTHYYHLVFNKKGFRYDAFDNDVSWDGMWKVVTRAESNWWSAEVFLPFEDFRIDKTVSDCWGINICRENHNKTEYSCWSPTYGDFHTPCRFGQVYFDKQVLSKYAVSGNDIKIPHHEVPPPLDVRTQYSLYTKEKEMLIRITFNLDEKILENAKLLIEIVDAENRTLRKNKFTKLFPEMDIKISKIDTLPPGNYTLVAQCLNKEGNSIARLTGKFKKLPPMQGEVKIDRISRITMVDSKPFIPFGLEMYGSEVNAELVNYLARNGFNTFGILVGPWNESSFGSILDTAVKAGLKVRVGILGWGSPAATGKKKAKEVIEKFKEHPAVLAWWIFDEVMSPQGIIDYHEDIEAGCKELKELDPYHPVYGNENRWGTGYLKSNHLEFPGDIVSIDHYAYPPFPDTGISLTGDYVKTAEEMGGKDGKPTWTYLFGSGYAFCTSRDFTPSEQEGSSYLSIVNGATSILYWANHPKSKSNWEKIKSLAGEIKELTPVIASTAEIPVITCSAPSIKFLTKKYNGSLFLITVNSSREPVSAKFDFSGVQLKPVKSSAAVLFENRKISIKDVVFEDKFAGYQRHVYKVTE